MQTYYEILQVSPEASEEVIKAAYKSLVKKYHPDSGLEKDSQKFIQIEEAYNVLIDAEERRRYDEMLQQKNKQQSEKAASTSVSVETVSKSNVKEVESEEKHRSNGGFGGSILGAAFWIFVIACFVTNMEQYRMQLLNRVGMYEFNAEEGDCNVRFYIEYENALIKRTPKVWLNVDGQRVQVLKEGDKINYDCKLSPGKHIVFVETKTLHVNSDIYTITVLPDTSRTVVECYVHGKWNWGTDFTVKNTYR